MLQEKNLFPLRDTTFEGMPVKVPFAYTEIIKEEYGEMALTQTNFEHHAWNEQSLLWEPTR